MTNQKKNNNLLNVLFVIIVAILGGFFGRLGGWEKGNRLFRMIGVPGCCVLILLFLNHPPDFWYYFSLFLTFGLVLGATSTYFKKKGSPVFWWNWLIYGFMEGIAFLPIAIYSHHWLGFGIRTVVCSGLICLWDEYIGIDWLEECGRYFIVVVTTPLILIG